MRIVVTSVLVDDQEKALRFYTDVLGFVKKIDISLANGQRWLTVVSPEDLDGPELALEPDSHPAARPVQTGAHGRWHPVYLVRSTGRPSRVRTPQRAGRALHTGAGASGPGHGRDIRRYLR